jgi:hypothetical protein
LNIEKKEIVKDIALNKLRDIRIPLYLFLTGGPGTRKPFTTKMIYQMLIRIHNENKTFDPLKPKGLIVTCIGKVAYNVGGTKIHFSFLIPFNKSEFVPISRKMPDMLSNIYQKLQLVLIEEASLVRI